MGSVAWTPDGFRYEPVSTLALGPSVAFAGGALQLNSPSNGQFMVEAAVAADGYPAVGFWLPQGGYGLVSAPLLSAEPATVDAGNLSAFLKRAGTVVGRPFTRSLRMSASAEISFDMGSD